jgi:hypothetical protein
MTLSNVANERHVEEAVQVRDVTRGVTFCVT